MSDWQEARVIFCGVSNNEKKKILFAKVIGHVNNCINANKAVHCFQMFTSAFYKILIQAILQVSILHYSLIKPPRKGTERIHHMLIQVYYRPFAQQCIKVSAHKRYMQSKVSKFYMQYCKPRYLSITDKNTRDFAQEWIFYRQFLMGYSFANCIVCVSFLSGIFNCV